jgi:hypothetical protein
MFNDASTFLSQQAHDLAGRIRAVADEFDSNEDHSAVSIAAAGSGRT